MTSGNDRGDDLLFPDSETKIRHRHTSKDRSRKGDSAREKTVKSGNRISWWHELINKGKDDHQLTKEGAMANQIRRRSSGMVPRAQTASTPQKCMTLVSFTSWKPMIKKTLKILFRIRKAARSQN